MESSCDMRQRLVELILGQLVGQLHKDTLEKLSLWLNLVLRRLEVALNLLEDII